MGGGIDYTCCLAYYGYHHALMEAMFLICCILAIASVNSSCATDATSNVPVSNTTELLKSQRLVNSPTELRKD
jgi:hypothetical protein